MNNEQKLNSLYEDLALIGPIHTVSQSEGGKVLVDTLLKTIVQNVITLCDNHGKLSHNEMISLCADMRSARDVARVLTRAEENKNYLEDELKATLAG